MFLISIVNLWGFFIHYYLQIPFMESIKWVFNYIFSASFVKNLVKDYLFLFTWKMT